MISRRLCPEICKNCNFCSIFGYLIMTRYFKNKPLVPEGSLEVSEKPEKWELPISPPEKKHNLRESTKNNTIETMQRVKEREIDKSMKSSTRFLNEVDIEMKRTFSEVLKNFPVHKVKWQLKKQFEITRKVNAAQRKRLFEKIKAEKIEKLGLGEKYS